MTLSTVSRNYIQENNLEYEDASGDFVVYASDSHAVVIDSYVGKIVTDIKGTDSYSRAIRAAEALDDERRGSEDSNSDERDEEEDDYLED